MKQNRPAPFVRTVFFVVVLLVYSSLCLVSCMPDEDIMEVTPRVVETAVTVTFPTEIDIPIANTLLPGTVPPLPGMVYWLGDGAWLVDADGQPQEILDDYLSMLSWSDTGKLTYFSNGILWAGDAYTGERYVLAPKEFGGIRVWHDWSAETGVLWVLDGTNADTLNGQFGRLLALDETGNELRPTEAYSRGAPALSPDEKVIALDEAGKPVLYHLETGKQILNLSDFGLSPELELLMPAWSSDQKMLAWAVYYSSNSQQKEDSIVIFDLEAKLAQYVYFDERLDLQISHLAWQPHGSKLALIRRSSNRTDFDSWIIDIATGERISLGAASRIQWSPDGNWLIYPSNDDRKGWWVMRADGREKHYLGDSFSIDGLIWSPDSRFLMICTDASTRLTSFENGWEVMPINFGYPVSCNTLQWLPGGQPEMIAAILTPAPSATFTNALPSVTATWTNTPTPVSTPTLAPLPSATFTPPPSPTAPPTQMPLPNPVVGCLPAPPVVDGAFNPAEWPEQPIVWFIPADDPESLVQVYAGRNGANLYLAFRVNDATNDLDDRMQVYFDVLNNGGDPDMDDRLFIIRRDGGMDIQTGIGNNSDGLTWNPDYANSNWIAVANASSQVDWTAEMQINQVAEMASLGDTFGLMVQAMIPGSIVWPAEANPVNIDTWQPVDGRACP